MTSRKRGRKAKAEDPRVKELERENARLQRRLARVETMLGDPKKNLRTAGDPHFESIGSPKRRDRLIVADRGPGGADWANGGKPASCSGRGSLHAVSQAPSSVTPKPKRRPRPYRLVLDETSSARRSSQPCTVSGSSTRRRPRCGPRTLDRAPTYASARIRTIVPDLTIRNERRGPGAHRNSNGAIRTTPSAELLAEAPRPGRWSWDITQASWPE